jgi:hypothetical protein
MRPNGPRDTIVGPEGGPEAPFPLKLGGKVIKGFGRGSKEVCNRLFDLHTLRRPCWVRDLNSGENIYA